MNSSTATKKCKLFAKRLEPPKTSLSEKNDLALQIITLADDVPYNVQMLAHFIWNRLSVIKVGAPETAYLTSGLIKEALNTLVRQSDAFYTQIWTNLTSNQKKALAGVVSENGGNLLSREISQITKMPTVTMQTALKSLTSQNILRQKEKEGLVHYIFEDPFFAHWIRFFTFLGQ